MRHSMARNFIKSSTSVGLCLYGVRHVVFSFWCCKPFWTGWGIRAVNLLGQLLQWSLFLNGTIFFGSRWHQNAFEACAQRGWKPPNEIREGGLNPPGAHLARSSSPRTWARHPTVETPSARRYLWSTEKNAFQTGWRNVSGTHTPVI